MNSQEAINLTSKRKKAQLNGLSDDEVIEHYLKYKSNLSPQTLKNYKYCLHKFQKFCMEHKLSIMNVDGEVISDFLALYSYKTTKETYRVTLNIFYKWCIKNKGIEDNPVEDISMSSGKKQAMVAMKVKDFIEIQRKSQSLRQLTIVSCLWYTGMRSKELRFLKLEDIDLKNGVIRISQSKTVTGYRTIPIHPSFRPLMAKYLQKRVNLDVVTDWVFLTKRVRNFQIVLLFISLHKAKLIWIAKLLPMTSAGHLSRDYTEKPRIWYCVRDSLDMHRLKLPVGTS